MCVLGFCVQTCSSAGRDLCSDGCPVCLRRSGWRRRRAMATPLSQVHPEAPFAKPPPPHLSRRGGVAVAKTPSIGSNVPKMPPGRWGPFADTQLASSSSGLPSEANVAWASGTPKPLEAAPTDSGTRRENNEVGVDLNPMPLEAAPTDSGLPPVRPTMSDLTASRRRRWRPLPQTTCCPVRPKTSTLTAARPSWMPRTGLRQAMPTRLRLTGSRWRRACPLAGECDGMARRSDGAT